MKLLRTVYVDEITVAKLDRLSSTTRIPKASLIREGIDLVLEKHEKQFERKKKKQEGR